MTYATYAALAAGTAAKYAAAQKTKSAQTAVQDMEAARQDKLRKEAAAALNVNIEGNTKMNVETEIADQTAKRTDTLTAALGKNADEIGVGSKLDELGVSAGNRLVQTDSATKSAENDAASKSLTKAMATMGGFGDMVMDRNVANARGLQEQGRFGNFMQGSNSAAAVEMDSAGHAGDSLSTVGDILNMVAVVSGGYAAQGTSPFNTAAENAAIVAKNQAAAAAAANAAAAAAPAAAAATPAANAVSSVGAWGKAAPFASLGSQLAGSLYNNKKYVSPYRTASSSGQFNV
jgi:hypothetical protein